MGVLIVICSLVLAAFVVMLISAPLRAAAHRDGPGAAPGEGSPEESRGAVEERRAELEAARESKYREIRDAELDYRTGKLSKGDYGAIDDQLRAEALEILDQLEALGARTDSAEAP